MSDLIATVEVSGEFDAVAKLRPGEPHFMLLGRDRLAPGLILRWASYNRRRALQEFAEGKISAERRDRELRKSRDAEFIAWDMHEFKRGDLAKKAAGKPTVKTYSGFELDEETKRRDALQATAIRAAFALNNAAAELAELAEFTTGEEQKERQWALEQEVAHLQSLSLTIKPSRPALRQRTVGKRR